MTVVTAPAPAAAAPVVDRPWTNSFVFGLVPPAPVDVSRECGAAGVSQVVTQRNFLNGLVAALTSSLYTPLQITATCAGARSSSADSAATTRAVALVPAMVTPAAPATPAAPR